MDGQEGEGRDHESALVPEMNRLWSVLKQAVIEAEQNSQENAELEKQYIRDIERERAEARTARATALELSHRLKNTVAVVQTIAHATPRPDVTPEDARARLQTLAPAHEILFDSNGTASTTDDH